MAVADAPPTIDATLEKAYKLAGIAVPFDDLIVADPYGDLKPGLVHAYYVGQSHVVAGITTDIVAYAGDGVFVQMWVGADDKLPRLVRAIYLDDPTTGVTNWRSRTGSWMKQCRQTRLRHLSAAATAKHIPFAAAQPQGLPRRKAPRQGQAD